jgi:glycosyltransferase involved in cell wall biosynthesis
MEPPLRKIWLDLRKDGAIRELDLRTTKPLRDVAEIEKLVALRADAVVATSEIVRRDLLSIGVPEERLRLVPNAIEDYWFEGGRPTASEHPSLIFLGRIGNDAFTLKLKGIDRLIDFYQKFPQAEKYTIGITTNKGLISWLATKLGNHHFFANMKKDRIPSILADKAGSILLVTSRYEGFSLSLIEGMSQGLIPVTYPVGIAPEIIENNRNGFLIQSQAEGKKTIEYLLHLGTEERERLADASRETAKKFTSKNIAKRLTEVYQDVLGKGRPKNGNGNA